jgi:hypothetical protein
MWRTLTGCAEFSIDNPNYYAETLNRVFGERIPKEIINGLILR